MGYHLERDEAIGDGIRRIAHEQIDKAIGDVQGAAEGNEERVHQLRKRCKKLRGLIRLVRPGMEETYDRENAFYRDLAGRFSHLRDHHVMIRTFDKLMGRHRGAIDSAPFKPLRRQLDVEAKRLAREQVKIADAMRETVVTLEDARERVSNWPVPDELDPLLAGVKKTYRRGRKALGEAQDDPSPERMHALRKRAKYTWYHYRLLRDLWPTVMKAYRDEADRLGDTLGDAHDLAVFEEHIDRLTHAVLDANTAAQLSQLAADRRGELDTVSLGVARLFYREKPKALVKRIKGYHKVWRDLPRDQLATV